jgi:hypothetical protein
MRFEARNQKRNFRFLVLGSVLWLAPFVLLCPAFVEGMEKSPQKSPAAPAAQPPAPGFSLKDLDANGQSAVVLDLLTGKEVRVLKHQKVGPWILMAVLEEGPEKMAVFEDLEDRKGSILYMSKEGIVVSLPKSLERTSVPEKTLYRGRTMNEIVKSPKDILASEILAEPGDPTFDRVAACLPPLRIPTFVGTRHSLEKVVFEYGGASINYVDCGKLKPDIMEARKKQNVWEGLVGRWLHVPRFLFPKGESGYWEEVVFAEEDATRYWTQPVWFRLLLVEDGQVKESHYFYHHLPYPPRGEPDAREFYRALLKMNREWRRTLDPPFKIDVPDKNIADFCRHALVLEMITRIGDHPRYGYPPIHQQTMSRGILGNGFSNVDSFQDTFNSSVLTFLDWGLFDIAKRYIDQYYSVFVRDDGSIDTRGPEIGQYGRMLTALAQYYNYTKDGSLILKHQTKILAIVKLLAGLRAESLKIPLADPGYGILRGWSEHDSGLQTDPYRFILPHFSNSAEVGRGFQDFGRALAEIGRSASDLALESAGNQLLQESRDMRKDLHARIEKSTDRTQDPPYIPAVAGDTPTLWKNRIYAEMLHSGILTKNMVKTIAASQSANGERILGLLRNGKSLSGFVVYGYAYGLLQHDFIREFLLFYYAHMAHIYSRGTWTAVEVAAVDGTPQSTFCTPAQLTIPALTKWMLVFEDPVEPVLWLAKATPRTWLEDGQKISVKGTPTKFGMVEYELRSEIAKNRVFGKIDLPKENFEATTKIRIRVPEGKKMKTVKVNGKTWKDFSPEQELISLPSNLKGRIELEVTYGLK